MLYPIELWVQVVNYQPLAMWGTRTHGVLIHALSDSIPEHVVWQTTIAALSPFRIQHALFFPAAAEGFDEADGGGVAAAG